MRFVVVVLACACMAVGGISVARADPPTTPSAATPAPATPAAAAAPAAPAPTTAVGATPQAASAVATPAIDPEEKRLLAQGYRIQMRNGEKVFCRTEEVTGSRLAQRLTCGTAAQLKVAQQLSKEALERAQRNGANKMPGE